jgi:ABC-type molybdenum transport system ATPase subunit/photorepair protein PhrA
MTLPSTAATPANKTLHQDFADIFSLLAVRKAEAGLVWISHYYPEIAATHERVLLLETNAVIVWQHCE